jgi:hypothetical protein
LFVPVDRYRQLAAFTAHGWPPLDLTAMPAWLIPYWIADMLVTLGLILIGLGLAGLALIWLRTRLGGGRQ